MPRMLGAAMAAGLLVLPQVASAQAARKLLADPSVREIVSTTTAAGLVLRAVKGYAERRAGPCRGTSSPTGGSCAGRARSSGPGAPRPRPRHHPR